MLPVVAVSCAVRYVGQEKWSVCGATRDIDAWFAGGLQSQRQQDFEQSEEPSEVCCAVGMHGVALMCTRRVLRAVECCSVYCRMYQ